MVSSLRSGSKSFRCKRFLVVRLQPLEFPNRPVKDVLVYEPLSAEELGEHLPEVLIVRPILFAQVMHIIEQLTNSVVKPANSSLALAPGFAFEVRLNLGRRPPDQKGGCG